VLQRYRRTEEEEKEEDDAVREWAPYIPVRERKREKLARLGDRLNRAKVAALAESSDEEKEDGEEDADDAQAMARKENISLLDQHTELKRLAEGISN